MPRYFTSKFCSFTGIADPLTVELLSFRFGSVTPLGGATVAVLETSCPLVAVPVIVIVTLLFAGKVGTVPLTSLPLTPGLAQTAAPLATLQDGIPVSVTVAGTRSSYDALSAESGPGLLMTRV